MRDGVVVLIIAVMVTVLTYFTVTALNGNDSAASKYPDHLSNSTGNQLAVNQCLVSANQLFFARLDSDGVLRIFQGIPENVVSATPTWSSSVSNTQKLFSKISKIRGIPFAVSLDVNGNLGINGSGWYSTSRANSPGPYYVVIQDTGKLVVFSGVYTSPFTSTQMWTSS